MLFWILLVPVVVLVIARLLYRAASPNRSSSTRDARYEASDAIWASTAFDSIQEADSDSSNCDSSDGGCDD